MSWETRLKKNIVLTAPDKTQFTAKWVAGKEEGEKTIGIFRYPKVTGTITQDLGISGRVYAFTLYFDGADNDVDASAFTSALSQRGPWTIQHPVKGKLTVQPTKYSETTDPTNSGGVTAIETEWIEVGFQTTQATTTQLAYVVVAQTGPVANTLSADLQAAPQVTAAETGGLRTGARSSFRLMQGDLTALAEQTPEGAAGFASVLRSFEQTLTDLPMEVALLASQIQAMVSIPAIYATDDIVSLLDDYSTMMDGLASIPDSVISSAMGITSSASRNALLVREAFMGAIASTMGVIAVSRPLPSRSAAVAQAMVLSDAFDVMVNHLDEKMDDFSDERMDRQYFSQSQSFVETSLLVAQAVAFVLQSSYDLPVEKIISIRKWRSPVEVVITETGDASDAALDAFLEANHLKGDELICLPPGKQVVVYV